MIGTRLVSGVSMAVAAVSVGGVALGGDHASARQTVPVRAASSSSASLKSVWHAAAPPTPTPTPTESSPSAPDPSPASSSSTPTERDLCSYRTVRVPIGPKQRKIRIRRTMPDSTKAVIAALNARVDRLAEMTIRLPSSSCLPYGLSPPYGGLLPQTTVGQQGSVPYVRPYIPSAGLEPYRRPAGVPIDTVEVRPLPPPVHIAPPPPRVFVP